MSATATGYCAEYLPEGPERDEALGLIRVGLIFRAEQRGRKPDAITAYLALLVREMPKPSFRTLLEKLEADSARHDYGAGECVCVGINRVHEVATFFHPKRGELEISFPSLIVKLSRLKKSLINAKPRC